MRKLQLFKHARSGFSLIEVIVALTVISIAFVAVATLVGRNLNSNNRNRDFLTAHYLTQESLEIVRNLRDSAWLNNYSLNGVGVAQIFGAELPTNEGQRGVTRYYRIVDGDRDQNNVVQTWQLAPLSGEPAFADVQLGRVRKDSGSFYTASSAGEPSSFGRFVEITQINPSDYNLPSSDIVLQAEAVTYFGDPSNPQAVSYTTLLTDWK